MLLFLEFYWLFLCILFFQDFHCTKRSYSSEEDGPQEIVLVILAILTPFTSSDTYDYVLVPQSRLDFSLGFVCLVLVPFIFFLFLFGEPLNHHRLLKLEFEFLLVHLAPAEF